MRLLQKSDITKLKGQERQKEADEGLKLARRVDALRAIQAEEESALEKFRQETLKKIHLETDTASQKLAEIQKEVSDLEDKRKALQEPLDAEWEKVQEHKESLDSFQTQIYGREQKLASQEDTYAQKIYELRVESERIAEEKQRADRALQETTEAEKDAKQALEDAKKIRTAAVEFRRKLTAELTERDAETAARERDVANKKTFLDSRETALNERERAINDKYETLLRNQKRLNL